MPATPADFKAAFSFVYEPQLSAERAAAEAAAAAAARRQTAAAAAATAAGPEGSDSANPAKVLDGLLVGLLGGLGAGKRGGEGKAAAAPGPRAFTYPPEDIAALNAAKRFLVSAGVVNK